MAYLGGTKICSGNWETNIQIFDLNSKKISKTLVGHFSGINSMCYIDNKYILSGGCDAAMNIYDPNTELDENNKDLEEDGEICYKGFINGHDDTISNGMLNILLRIKEYLTDEKNIKDINSAIAYYGQQVRYGERMFFLSKQSNEPLNEFFNCLKLYFQIKIPNILIETTKSIEVAYDNQDNKQKYLYEKNNLYFANH